MKKFKLLIASNDGVSLASSHFGDADMYYRYEIDEAGGACCEDAIKNKFKNVDEHAAHGAKEKRQSIISYACKDIDFIIASQMSPNFKNINVNTRICPVVSEIKDVSALLSHLKINFDLLVKAQKTKSAKRIPEILVIRKEK